VTEGLDVIVARLRNKSDMVSENEGIVQCDAKKFDVVCQRNSGASNINTADCSERAVTLACAKKD
jgi:hypothetical protein